MVYPSVSKYGNGQPTINRGFHGQKSSVNGGFSQQAMIYKRVYNSTVPGGSKFLAHNAIVIPIVIPMAR
jgi:hypothetical protein